MESVCLKFWARLVASCLFINCIWDLRIMYIYIHIYICMTIRRGKIEIETSTIQRDEICISESARCQTENP